MRDAQFLPCPALRIVHSLLFTFLSRAVREYRHKNGLFGKPRDFLDNRFAYLVISSRSRGLTIGLNLNPDKQCNFDCVYCEVERAVPSAVTRVDIPQMINELEQTLMFVQSGKIREHPDYQGLPEDLLELRGVLLSGDGEPTMCPLFSEVIAGVDSVRKRGRFPWFKLVLLTNATGLDAPANQGGLELLGKTQDEVWVKLDAGTVGFMNRVNRPQATLEKVLSNILIIGRQRPIIVQSLFCGLADAEPDPAEILAYAQRLKVLREEGAMISLVQIYSANRPAARPDCKHLPLRALAQIAKTVQTVSGLRAEVF